jgi:hypothetical protein
MATGNTSYSTLITTTLQDHGKEIFDAVSTNNALWWMLNKSGNIKVRKGGRTFTHPLVYKTNSSFAMYAKLGTISLPVTDNVTRAEYPIKVAAGSIVLSTIDLAMNAGDREKLLDLAEEKKLEATISMSELMGDQVFADGTGANDFDGLQHLINDTPSTQTDVGGIDPSASGNEYWQNTIDTTAVTAFNTSQAGLTVMNNILNSTTFGRQGPKAIFTTKAIYQLYELGLTSNIRYANTDLADAGFRSLQFTTLPILFDDNCNASAMYFVDTDSLWLQVLAQANMQVTQFQLKEDQLASSSLMYLAGNLTTGSRRTQGKATNITG